MANGLIGKVTAGGGTHLITSTAYFTCATAAATAAKVAKAADTGLNSLTVITGMTIYVKFTNTNEVANPTLTLQTNGGTELLAAKSIMRYGITAPSTSAASSWKAGAVVALVYDGTNWVEVSSIDDNTTYSAMSVAEMKTGTATSSRVIRADYLKSAFTASDGIFKTGSANGTISVYGTDIAVKGLGSRAYDSTSYLPLTGGTLTGNLIVNDSTANETTTLSANSLIATGIDVESNTSEVGFIFDGANKVIETTPNTAVYINGYLYANSDELTIASATNTVDDNTDVFLNSSLKMSSRTSANSTPITKNVLYAYNGLDEGIGVLLQGDGTTVVAAGEAGRNLIKENVNNAQAGNGEQLHLASDTAIYFYSNCQTISDRKQISFGADGKLTVPGRIKQADPDVLTAFETYSTANTTVTLTSKYTNYNFLILRFGANNGDNSSMAGISTMIIPTSMINASNEFQHGWYHGSTWQHMKFQFPTTTSLKILTRVGSATGLRQVLAF